MPSYRFHVFNDIDTPPGDSESFDSLAAAHLKAVSYARALAADSVKLGRLHLGHRIDIEDEGGAVLATVTFADVVDVVG